MEEESISSIVHPYSQMSFPQSSVLACISSHSIPSVLVVKATPRDHFHRLGL